MLLYRKEYIHTHQEKGKRKDRVAEIKGERTSTYIFLYNLTLNNVNVSPIQAISKNEGEEDPKLTTNRNTPNFLKFIA